MPKIISFAWTTPALLAGQKTVTRRAWNDDYARRFKPGEIVHAYNRSPRHRGEHVATLRIVSVTKERDIMTANSDYEAEGFAWLERHPEHLPKGGRLAYLEAVSRAAFVEWRKAGGTSWVCRFEVVEVIADVPTVEPLVPASPEVAHQDDPGLRGQPQTDMGVAVQR